MGESLIKKLRRRQEKQAFDDMARELVLEKWADFCTKADIVILYTLWKEFGFGRKRLERFYRRMIANQHEMIERFRTERDDGSYWVMQKRLEDATGIDIVALQAEGDDAE